jgi:hypothetical protein
MRPESSDLGGWGGEGWMVGEGGEEEEEEEMRK